MRLPLLNHLISTNKVIKFIKYVSTLINYCLDYHDNFGYDRSSEGKSFFVL